MENKYVSKFISELYLDSEFADVHFEFTSDGQTIIVPANKLILGKASKVFRAMFFGPMKEKEDIVKIIDCDAGAFKEFLQFFYLPKVTLTMGNVEAVIRLADKYDMPDCLNICGEFLKNEIMDGNVFWGYQLASSFKMQNLMNSCERRIKLMTGDDFKSEQFLCCSRDVLESILCIETMLCTEAELFNACIAWAKRSCQSNEGACENNPRHLKEALGEGFYSIRFATMTNDELANILANEIHVMLFDRDEVADILRARMDKSFASEMFIGTPRSEPTLKWDDKRALCCILPTSGTQRTIQSRASIWFTTDAPVLLGGQISVKPITKNNNTFGCSELWSISFTISILEHMEQSFDSNVRNNVIFEGTLQLSNYNSVYANSASSASTVSLPKPKFIHKKRMYEIRLVANSDTSSYRAYSSDMTPIKVNVKVTIEFKTPSADGSHELGLISGLQFNEIQFDQL